MGIRCFQCQALLLMIFCVHVVLLLLLRSNGRIRTIGEAAKKNRWQVNPVLSQLPTLRLQITCTAHVYVNRIWFRCQKLTRVNVNIDFLMMDGSIDRSIAQFRIRIWLLTSRHYGLALCGLEGIAMLFILPLRSPVDQFVNRISSIHLLLAFALRSSNLFAAHYRHCPSWMCSFANIKFVLSFIIMRGQVSNLTRMKLTFFNWFNWRQLI